MTDTITVAGLIATPIKNTTTADGLEISSFRLASNSRRYDRAAQAWVDGETNWFTITTFRQLASNVRASLDKGHRVVVAGRLRVREWRDGEKLGRDVEVIADAIGPDLAWGRAHYTRTPRQTISTDAGETSTPNGVPDSAAATEAQPESEAHGDEHGGAHDSEQVPVTAEEPVATPF